MVMRKIFRIVRNELSKEGEQAYHPLRYRIEQRRTILCFIHWWSTPLFAPPHLFEFPDEAVEKIKEECGNNINIIMEDEK